MNTIWKYTLQPRIDIEMPLGSKILEVREQNNDACMWVLVNPEMETTIRHFVVYGTGMEINTPLDELLYHGTVQLNEGQLVFHVFEILD